jgi:hypothetical protein
MQNASAGVFTRIACQRRVLAGPVEATVLGNVLVQVRAAGELTTLDDLRRVARDSSTVEEISPAHAAAWDEAPRRFAELRLRRQLAGP